MEPLDTRLRRNAHIRRERADVYRRIAQLTTDQALRTRTERAAADFDELAGEMEALSALIVDATRRSRALTADIRQSILNVGSLLDALKGKLNPSTATADALREDSRLCRDEVSVSVNAGTKRSLAAHAFYLAQIAEVMARRPDIEAEIDAGDDRLLHTARALVAYHGFRAVEIARSTARLLGDQDQDDAAERWEAISTLIETILGDS